MSRPRSSTPVTIVVNVLRDVAGWYVTHQTALSEELDEQYDGETIATELADKLEIKQKTYKQEQKEDRDVTDDRDQTIEHLRLFYRSVLASVRRRSKQKGVSKRIVGDFQIGQPSRVRTLSQAQKFLNKLTTAVNLHQDDLSQGKDRTTQWLKRIKELKGEFKQIAADASRESTETATARKERDDVRDVAVSFLEDMELAATSVLDLDPTPYDELQIIFTTQNPESPSQASAPEDSITEDTDTEDTNTPSSDATPAQPNVSTMTNGPQTSPNQ